MRKSCADADAAPSIVPQVCDGSGTDSRLPEPPGRPRSEHQPLLKLWAGVDQEETRKQVCPGEPNPCGFVGKGLGVGNVLAQMRNLRGALMYETPTGFSLSASMVSQVLSKA